LAGLEDCSDRLKGAFTFSQNLFILLLLRCFMDLKTAIKKRKSVRRFMGKKPDWRKIIRAIDASRYAPTAGNNFVMKFILVSDEDKIAEIAAATQQGYVGTAKYVVVAVSDDSKLVRLYGDKGTRYSSQQAGAAIQNFLLASTELGLSTTWVGFFYEDQIKSALGIPEDLIVEAVFPVGKETAIKERAKSEPELENLLYFDKWKNKKMEPISRVTLEAF